MNFRLIVILSLILYFSQELLVAIVYYIFARLNMDYTSAPFLVLDLPPSIASILVFSITALHIKGSFFLHVLGIYIFRSSYVFFVDHVLFDFPFGWSVWIVDFFLTAIAIGLAAVFYGLRNL